MEDLHDNPNLQRLLALKRHEVPPPGYFDRFSSQVIARIRAGDAGETAQVAESGIGGWFQRVLGGLELRSAFASALGVTVCAVLLTGLFRSDTTTDATAGLLQVSRPVPVGLQAVNLETPGFHAVPQVTQVTLGPTNAGGDVPALPSLFQEAERFRAPSLLIDYKPGN